MAMGSLTRGRPSHRERERLKLNTNPMNIAVGAASLAVAPAAESTHEGPQANLAFNPQPTQSSKCSKLKLKLVLDKTLYVAGGKLQGRVEVTSFSHNNLYLGDISIELKGSEELTDANPSARSFFHLVLRFQGDRLPQTRAVRGTCKDGYWQANKGKTVFPFTFLLPEDAPVSYTFQSIASLKYMLTG
ncbi:hypothetical protein BASA81_017446 [Batrachochytrium salamandrivorans]|nr:hypothetical protein BASA81_017446 [Batrachochytrium salamandrivorans]